MFGFGPPAANVWRLMRLLIDGYNLMYAAGIVGPPVAASEAWTLAHRLDQFVAGTLEPGDKIRRSSSSMRQALRPACRIRC